MPQEIIHKVIDVSDQPTQIRWVQTCRNLRDYTISKVWSDLYINFKDTANGEVKDTERTRLDCLVKDLPGMGDRGINKVRTLHVNCSRRNTQSPPQSQLKPQDLERWFRPLLSVLSGLTCCVYEGALYQASLRDIVETTPSLSTLELRINDWLIESGRFRMIDERRIGHWEPWVAGDLDFSVLASMQNLQTLKIGRLQWWESIRLADVIGTLPLRHLELSACPWTYCFTASSRERYSSVTYFLVCLEQCRQRLLSPSTGLPTTLETLFLRNRFHWVVSDAEVAVDFEQLLRDACQERLNLRTIELTMPKREGVYNFLAKFGLYDTIAFFGDGAVRPGWISDLQGPFCSCSLRIQLSWYGGSLHGETKLPLSPEGASWRFAVTDDPYDLVVRDDDSKAVHGQVLMAGKLLNCERHKVHNELRAVRFQRMD